MANVTFFSPDGGTTRYPIEDTEARSRIAGQQNQLNAQGVLGAKNLLKINISTQVVSGITFTVNKDDNGNVLSITANGTATADANIDVFNSSSNPIIGEYIVTGTPETGSADTYYLTCNIPANPAGYRWLKDEGKGVRLTSNNACTIIRLSILSGQTVSNAVFKPMLRLASDPDDTYVPFAMTNRELTERAFNTENVSVTPNSGYTVNFNDLKAKNGLVFGRLEIVKSSAFTLNSWVDIGTASIPPSAFTLSTIVDGENASYVGLARISTNGIIGVFITTNPTNNKFIAPSMMYFIDK